MNKIIIIGNLGKDAEVRKSSNGTNYLTFAIADNEIVKGERKTYWYNVTAFTFNEKLVQYYKTVPDYQSCSNHLLNEYASHLT